MQPSAIVHSCLVALAGFPGNVVADETRAGSRVKVVVAYSVCEQTRRLDDPRCYGKEFTAVTSCIRGTLHLRLPHADAPEGHSDVGNEVTAVRRVKTRTEVLRGMPTTPMVATKVRAEPTIGGQPMLRPSTMAPRLEGAPATAPPATPNAAVTPPNSFRDCPVCPEMVVVPSGEFKMGSPQSELGRNDDEGIQRKITIVNPLAVGKYEVTFAEWDACVSAGFCKNKPDDGTWGRDKRPAMNVSWHDAKEYLAWLSQKSGKPYRLLSEAEWEYVARAGTTGRWHFDGDEAELCQYANHADESVSFGWKNFGCNDGVGERTAEIGRYKPNPFGLHDMHGNVWEWVEDCYETDYKSAPTDGLPKSHTDCSSRVIRGGSWVSYPRSTRSAVRAAASPDNRDNDLGFRVARTLRR